MLYILSDPLYILPSHLFSLLLVSELMIRVSIDGHVSSFWSTCLALLLWLGHFAPSLTTDETVLLVLLLLAALDKHSIVPGHSLETQTSVYAFKEVISPLTSHPAKGLEPHIFKG